uniref:Uncharacterized protein n=1 Tax=Arundo donax TaxID=35708 RepID=A0A0A9D7H8_ARUDO
MDRYHDMMESSSTGPDDLPPSALGRIQDTTGQTQVSAASHLRRLPPPPDAPPVMPPASLADARCIIHSSLAARPRTRPHFSDMWRSQRWSPRHRFRMERQTAAMLRSSAGCSRSRMQSMASSGRSSTDGSPAAASSTFSTLSADRFLLKDGMSGMVSVAAASAAATPPSSRRPAKNPSNGSASSWHRDGRNSLMSRAHGLDRTSRPETTKAASRASISERRRRSALPQAKPQPVELLLRPKPHQQLVFNLFCRFLSRPDRRSRAGDAMEPTLREEGEKESAAQGRKQLGRIRSNGSPGNREMQDTCCRAASSWIDSSSATKNSSNLTTIWLL